MAANPFPFPLIFLSADCSRLIPTPLSLYGKAYMVILLSGWSFWIDMKKLNFSAGAPILSLKAYRPGLAGDVSRLFANCREEGLYLLPSD